MNAFVATMKYADSQRPRRGNAAPSCPRAPMRFLPHRKSPSEVLSRKNANIPSMRQRLADDAARDGLNPAQFVPNWNSIGNAR